MHGSGEGSGGGSGIPLWYITFSDLMAILVGFFILLFGFSTMEAHRFKQIASSMRQAFGERPDSGGPGAPGASSPNGTPGNAPDHRTAAIGPGKAAVYARAVETLASLGLGPAVETELDEQGVRFRISDALLFPAASATLQREAYPLLDRLAAFAVKAGGNVVVEGHTDNQPTARDAFPSNWELSGARAGAVVRYFAGQGLPGFRLEAQAFADTRPRRPNQTWEGRQKNRRVEILLRTEP